MVRTLGWRVLLIVLGGTIGSTDSFARTPQDGVADWYKYDAVQEVYKQGFPVLRATHVVYYDWEKAPNSPVPTFEDVVLLLDTKTIGHFPVKVRRVFKKEYETNWKASAIGQDNAAS